MRRSEKSTIRGRTIRQLGSVLDGSVAHAGAKLQSAVRAVKELGGVGQLLKEDGPSNNVWRKIAKQIS